MDRISHSLKSFTLIELVIVLAMLAILSALAITRFVDITKKTYDATENATIDALRTAIRFYMAKYETWPDFNLFTLLENPPPNKEEVCWGCTRDGKTWRTYQAPAGPQPPPWTIECPHTNAQSGGVMRAWYYYSGREASCVPCGAGGLCNPGTICEIPLAAGGHHI